MTLAGIFFLSWLFGGPLAYLLIAANWTAHTRRHPPFLSAVSTDTHVPTADVSGVRE